ncbi:MAG TPA: glycoside hydrolase family 3 protein [Candidatus Limnocylindria bacterium]|nr:glycoside hydrolase family 3 protein [Candidatus Limnocylindria bacterium]
MTELGTGALVWAGFDGERAPGALLDAIRDGRIGGLLLFAFRGNVRSKEQVRAMIHEVQEAARRGGLPPIPVAVDQEGGSVVRVGYRAVFPSAMAIGATGEPSYAERAARAVALGLLADGITVNHAPVCDVNVEPRNPVIGTRSFGDDPERVAELAAAWVRGSEGAGVATSPKHFAGHGDTSLDSHFTRPDITADRATLDRRELRPFRAAFAAGASMVMTAHVRYTALDPAAPATISRPILTDLLRGELGFEGLCVTDSLDMTGIADAISAEEVITTGLEAGVDAMMVTSGLTRQLAAAGWIAERVRPERIREALSRASRFRERFGREVPDTDIDNRPARELASEIASASITHIGPPMPHLGGKVRVVYFTPKQVSPVEELATPGATFEAALRRHLGARVAFATDGAAPEGDGPLVVCSTNASFEPEQAERVRALVAGGGVLCALRSPYDAALVPDRPTLLSYGDVPASLEALAAVLAGERLPLGRLPVRLPNRRAFAHDFA